ncbi:MAG: glycoside hydrolase family 88 protein, partial [Dehalococcoidia bacterium]
ASSSGNDGQLSNGAELGHPGTLDKAVNFPASGQVQIGTTNWNADRGSIALWVRADAFASGDQYLFGHTTQPAWSNRIQLYTNDSSGLLDLGLGSSHTLAIGVADLDAQIWHHIVLTWEGAGGSGTYRLYVDQQEVASGQYTGLNQLHSFAHIGNDGNNGTRPFDGLIDETRVYNRALSAQEVILLHNLEPEPDPVVQLMKKVNDYWIGNNTLGDNKWARGAYFVGNMAAYRTMTDAADREAYLDWAFAWAEQNNYALNGGVNTVDSDNHAAGQTYIELYSEWPQLTSPAWNQPQIGDIESSIHRLVANVDPNRSCAKRTSQEQPNEDWCWIDALFMAMPVFTKLGNLAETDPAALIHGHTGAEYFQKMYDLYNHTKNLEDTQSWQNSGTVRGLYDEKENLWYRDRSYLDQTTPNGKKIFWSRGNGWVFAAHARVLDELPSNDPHRQEYEATFAAMAAKLMAVQRADGFWNMNLGDPNDAPGPETSGTAFFTYGLAWGINNRILDRPTYLPVVEKAWQAMETQAVHPDGKLGYVQNVGQEHTPQPPTYDETRDFGVGAFLLAGSEVAEMQ